ncbi:MAG: GGDEF domain-containing response regulator [Myxococcota bacterium]
MSVDPANHRLSVLVVDDDLVDRMVVARLLESTFDVTLVSSAGEALERLATERFHCVLIDYRLPDADGISVLDALWADAAAPAAIMLTGSGDEAVAVNAMKHGAHDYLTKAGLDRDRLVAAIFEAHGRQRAAREEHLEQVRLARLANFDQLTDLYSRAWFDERLAHELKRSRRYGSALALALIDVDQFKELNDTLGHLGGDDVLRAVAQAIQGSVRDVDFAARWGGDEFCVLLPKTDLESCQRIGNRICEGSRAIRFATEKGCAMSVSCSVGIAAWQGGDLDQLRFVRAADAALYRAKNAGRDRCVVDRLVHTE